MAFVNPLRERWRSGQVVYTAWLVSADPLVAEILAGSGVDAIVIDQQHGCTGVDRLFPLLLAVEGRGAAPITRVSANDAAEIGRALDFGTLGIIVPMVNSAEEAARAVTACRYATRGNRSLGPIRPHATVGSTSPFEIEAAPAIILQVETTEALAAVDGIAAVPGVDALYVGPNDLALSLGMSPHAAERSAEEAQRHAAALATVVEACGRAGIAAGVYGTDGVSARGFARQGFRMVNVATDTVTLACACAAEVAAARGAG